MTVAALYVETGGCYFGLSDVEPWDEARDARRYEGIWPVVAHPPCKRWGRYWYGSPLGPKRFRKGDDGSCFINALRAVRMWGGVLEHPANSHAWEAFELNRPSPRGGWIAADFSGGWTCQVDQGWFGHRARKPTWLYAVGCELPTLPWAPKRIPDPDGRVRRGVVALMSHKQRDATPIPFRDLLLSMARSVARRITPDARGAK